MYAGCTTDRGQRGPRWVLSPQCCARHFGGSVCPPRGARGGYTRNSGPRRRRDSCRGGGRLGRGNTSSCAAVWGGRHHRAPWHGAMGYSFGLDDGCPDAPRATGGHEGKSPDGTTGRASLGGAWAIGPQPMEGPPGQERHPPLLNTFTTIYQRKVLAPLWPASGLFASDILFRSNRLSSSATVPRHSQTRHASSVGPQRANRTMLEGGAGAPLRSLPCPPLCWRHDTASNAR